MKTTTATATAAAAAAGAAAAAATTTTTTTIMGRVASCMDIQMLSYNSHKHKHKHKHNRMTGHGGDLDVVAEAGQAHGVGEDDGAHQRRDEHLARTYALRGLLGCHDRDSDKGRP